MQPLDPMMAEMILNGDKPRELYTVQCLVKIRPDETNVSRVMLFSHQWFLFADTAEDARSIWWANAPEDYMGQSFEVERVIAIVPSHGPVSEIDMLKVDEMGTGGIHAVEH
jgi:hypothetical protein